MENQHRKISGYRELTESDIAAINVIKAKGEDLKGLLKDLTKRQAEITVEFGTPDAEALRWIEIGRTQLQLGLMSITRAVAKPETF